MKIMREIRSSRKGDEAKIALRSILSDFFADCYLLDSCWYRINSAQNKCIPGTELPSHIYALSKVFGMYDRVSDDLL
jgi:hypothetical protein